MAKVAISIPDDLLQDMDSYAKAHYMSRSGFISMCSHQFLQSVEFQRVIGSISDSLARLAKSAEAGSIDEDALRELEQFKNFADVVISAQSKMA